MDGEQFERDVKAAYRGALRESVLAVWLAVAFTACGWRAFGAFCLLMAGLFGALAVFDAKLYRDHCGRWPWREE